MSLSPAYITLVTLVFSIRHLFLYFHTPLNVIHTPSYIPLYHPATYTPLLNTPLYITPLNKPLYYFSLPITPLLLPLQHTYLRYLTLNKQLHTLDLIHSITYFLQSRRQIKGKNKYIKTSPLIAAPIGKVELSGQERGQFRFALYNVSAPLLVPPPLPEVLVTPSPSHLTSSLIFSVAHRFFLCHRRGPCPLPCTVLHSFSFVLPVCLFRPLIKAHQIFNNDTHTHTH